MSLHGPIQVNSRTIGAWSARRLTPMLDPDGTAEYECLVSLYTDDPPHVRRHVLRHRYDDGALVLAAKVLAAAAELTPPAELAVVPHQTIWHDEADRLATWGALDPPDACMCTDCVLGEGHDHGGEEGS